MPRRALVATDHDLLAQGLAAVLRTETHVDADAADSAAVRAHLDNAGPGAYDIVLLDVDQHDEPDELIRTLQAAGMRVVVLAGTEAAHQRATVARPAGIVRTDQPDADVPQVVLEALRDG